MRYPDVGNCRSGGRDEQPEEQSDDDASAHHGESRGTRLAVGSSRLRVRAEAPTFEMVFVVA
jgi:hypothetical protein